MAAARAKLPDREPSRRRIAHGAKNLLAAFGVLVLAVSATPMVPWWARLLGGRPGAPGGEVLILLAASAWKDGIVTDSSYWRCACALRAWRRGGYREILIAGGSREEPPPSLAMKEFLVGSGVPAAVIRVDPDSYSTRENALHAARLLAGDTRRKVLVTSDAHMFRAKRVFARAGVAVEPLPCPEFQGRAQWMNNWMLFQQLCYETLKTGYYFARGWI